MKTNINSYASAILIAVIELFSFPQIAAAKVIYAASCSLTDVKDAIKAAADGDTVIVPAGECTWGSALILPNTKGIQLLGPGNNTPKSYGTFPLVITSSSGIIINVENNKSLYRISGFKFQNSSGSGSFITITGRGKGKAGIGAYRIDNNFFNGVKNDQTIRIDADKGEMTGLIDNNTFLDTGPNQNVYTIMIRESFKGNSSTCYGNDAWQRAFVYGSSNFHFVEDNLFSRPNSEGRHDVSTDGASGKFVVRYNIFDRSYSSNYQLDYVDCHGDGTNGLGQGGRGGEIYGNTFKGNAKSVYRNVALRGGWWLVYDNTFTAGIPSFLTEYRASTSYCNQVQNPSLCNAGVPQCADAQSFAKWYPLPAQIQHTYFWNNRLNGTDTPPTISRENYVPLYIKLDRDYFVSSVKPDALSSYTPYTYPHPLRSDISTNIIEIEGNNSIKVYPNPFTESTTFDFSNLKKAYGDNLSLSLYNMMGEKVVALPNISEEKVILEKKKLKVGMYLYKITLDKKIMGSGKLMVK